MWVWGGRARRLQLAASSFHDTEQLLDKAPRTAPLVSLATLEHAPKVLWLLQGGWVCCIP